MFLAWRCPYVRSKCPPVGASADYAGIARCWLQGHVPACLVAAVNAHAAEAIRQGEPEPGTGLLVSEIAKASNVDPAKLGRS